MNYDYDHDRFVAKNRALAAADSIKQRDDALEKKGYSYFERQEEASCFNCKMKQNCSEFKSKRTGKATGVVSFGGDEKFVCKRYTPATSSSKGMSEKQVKSLMKNFKRGHK